MPSSTRTQKIDPADNLDPGGVSDGWRVVWGEGKKMLPNRCYFSRPHFLITGKGKRSVDGKVKVSHQSRETIVVMINSMIH
jgi:hypothetical protein